MTTRRARGIGLAFLAALVSGVAVFVNGYGVRAVPDAGVYTTAKNLVAAAVLLAVAAIVSRRGPRRSSGSGNDRPLSRPLRIAGLTTIAVIGGSVPFLLFFEGLARASSTQAAFVHKTLVVWVAILAVALLGERLRLAHVAAIAALVAGQAVLGGGLGAFRLGAGELLLFVATLLWSVEVVLAKRLLRQVSVPHLAVARMAGGAALLVAWVAITGRWSVLSGLTWRGWMWAAVTGVILSGYVGLWLSALALAPAIDVTAVLVVAAVVTGLLNVAINAAAPSGTAIAGMVLLACGAGIAAVAGRRSPVLLPS